MKRSPPLTILGIVATLVLASCSESAGQTTTVASVTAPTAMDHPDTHSPIGLCRANTVDLPHRRQRNPRNRGGF